MSVPAESVPAPAADLPTREIALEFRATGSEYFRIWIVNLLLTILTLGIYSAWAKVRRLRYFYGNTLLDGSAFEYHGKPIAILKGRLIAFGIWLVVVIVTEIQPKTAVLLFVLVIFGVPWIIQRSRLFQMRMSSYRGLRFNFHGTYGGALGAYIGWALLAVITLGILTPVFLWKRVNYLLNNAAYGTERFRFKSTIGEFYGFWLKTMGMGLGLVFVMAALFGVLGGGAMAAARNAPDQALAALLGGAMFPALLLGAVLFLGIIGYFQKSFLNASFGGLELGPHRVLSRLRAWPLIWIYTGNLLIVVFTFGLGYPWAIVRQMRYQLTNTSVRVQGDLDQFRASAGAGTDAIGEEIGDFFDVDFGL